MANEIYSSSWWGEGVCTNTIDWGSSYKSLANCTPSPPAFSTIILKGASTALLIICTPVVSSKFTVVIFSKTLKKSITDIFLDNEVKSMKSDLVISNATIEHVGSFENQKKMAQEVIRVGKKYIIQTPNKYFFIEPHYLLPFFGYLPKPIKFWILTKTKLSRLKKWDEKFAKQYIQEIRLISEKEMKILFPNSKIYFEKFLGMNKSFTTHNF